MAVYALRTTNVPVPFDRLRKMWLTAPMQEGVANAGDLKVTQRAAGANMSVDVAPGAFWIKTDIDTPDGLVPGYSDAIGNFAVAAAHATLPRIDALYLQYNDSALGAGVGGDTPTFRLLTGTATAGAQATNFAGANYRAGAPTPPNDALLIADIPVPAAAASITNANIIDRRPWARGAAFTLVGNGAGNHTTTGTTAGSLAAGAYDIRLECSGATLDVDFTAIAAHNVAGGTVSLLLLLDGVTVRRSDMGSGVANLGEPLVLQYSSPVAAGSHLLTWQWDIVTAGTGTMFNSSAAIAPNVRFREVVRQNASNT